MAKKGKKKGKSEVQKITKIWKSQDQKELFW